MQSALDRVSRLRNFVFTVNNYTDVEKSNVNEFAARCRYLVYGEEVGESGTPHLQGYAELTRLTRFNKIKELLPRAHIEKRRGTAKQAAQYCKKEGKFREFGEISRQGARSDVLELYEMVKEGKSDYELQEYNAQAYCRYYKGVDRFRFNTCRQDNKYSPVEVLVWWGPAGVGKTRRAYELAPDLYRVVDPQWWDGYQGQDTILLDDFYGGIKYSYFLQITDGYKFQLPIKGGYTWKQWSRVIITSNDPPENWYSVGLTSAISRRLTETKELTA